MRKISVHWLMVAALALAPTAAFAQQTEQPKQEVAKKEEPKKEAEPQKQPDETQQPKTDEESKLNSVLGGKALGMSILGNQEAPKALVIVPWKSSEVGDSMGISTVLDDSRLPIDKEVFMRALSYFAIRSETTRHEGAMPASAAQGRKQ